MAVPVSAYYITVWYIYSYLGCLYYILEMVSSVSRDSFAQHHNIINSSRFIILKFQMALVSQIPFW